ncbi:hypothetical protein HNR46_002879 [Haloferula luteola]|uniref:PEP-CTERM protein-sorting domain-containing protein n=1 Tax=Haloferula luteola TaxID=595692 RepID=A0A840VIU9_9BACT|nr:hypothetical protein [Haloferula luteola]MBB5352631.1 hypothetical protein [Haloferula luteola]
MFAKCPVLAAMLGLAASAGAQSINLSYDDTFPFDPETYHHTNSWVVDQVGFNTTSGTMTVVPVGGYRTTVITPDGSSVSVYDFCSELYVGLSTPPVYDVSVGLGSLSTAKQDALQVFLSNALPLFLSTSTGTYAAAIQLGIWEIIEDGNPYLGLDPTYTLDSSIAGQNLSANIADTGVGDATDAVNLANSWLANVTDGTWSDEGGMTYFYADSVDGQQDRIWVALGTVTIPEPSVALLGLVGTFGLVLRRRR